MSVSAEFGAASASSESVTSPSKLVSLSASPVSFLYISVLLKPSSENKLVLCVPLDADDTVGGTACDVRFRVGESSHNNRPYDVLVLWIEAARVNHLRENEGTEACHPLTYILRDVCGRAISLASFPSFLCFSASAPFPPPRPQSNFPHWNPVC
jgi:hypothetical protein